MLAALRHKKEKLSDQRIVIMGAGSAGMGISERIALSIIAESDEQTAKDCFWLVDRDGLITDQTESVTEAQQPYVKSREMIQDWNVKDPNAISLEEVVRNLKPTILVGTSAQRGAFTKEIVQEMYQHEKQPIIFVLSNPNEKAEAQPENLYEWTDGAVFVAAGSPFPDVNYKGKVYPISQCNNYLAFPGIGLGVTAVKATHINDEMLMAAAHAISQHTDTASHRLLPSLAEAQATSLSVAIAVAKKAVELGYTELTTADDIPAIVKNAQWTPAYLPYKYNSDLG